MDLNPVYKWFRKTKSECWGLALHGFSFVERDAFHSHLEGGVVVKVVSLELGIDLFLSWF